MSSENIRDLHKGKIIGGRWRLVSKIGEGAMGAIYKVEDRKRKNFCGALKLESDLSEGGVLKLEVFVLKKLQGLKHTVKLYDSGQTNKYCFMVMSLLGKDLWRLRVESNKPFSESTTLRVAINTLFAIKKVHELGYVHRDIKPGNFLIGRIGREKRILFLIDYGMVRSFVATDKDTGKLAIRQPRDGAQLFRGTPKYCSLNCHYRKEQGRVDDLWSWLYSLIEIHCKLPWSALLEENKVLPIKEACSENDLLRRCPEEFRKIYRYLKTLKYEDRPDYYGLFSECMAGLKRVRGSFLDRYEWETEIKDDMETALSISDEDRKTHKPVGRNRIAQKIYPFATKEVFRENILNL
ncbi:unnamed protein product [Cylicocyclus nassatus]|uniref:non-specific serine/threonine protein kinase n=1 Tax=Cylicocyclus nassatus TaxID=53992 RepID=A0AA36MA62_CYLNA|nr:unnamed protein product [Cylicocyclus nassatus]